jgi:hypothetical protein
MIPPGGDTVGSIAHPLPFQRSANVRLVTLIADIPAASQARALGHDTPNSRLPVAAVVVPGAAFGVGWTAHDDAIAPAGATASTATTSNQAQATRKRPPIGTPSVSSEASKAESTKN